MPNRDGLPSTLMPLSPSVTALQRYARPQMTMARERVIIRKYTPTARMARKPKNAAKASATTSPKMKM